MVDSIWPVNAVAGAPAYGGRMLRQTGATALSGATSTRPLGARSGVRPGTSIATVTANSTTWTCGAFAGVADVEAAAEAGAYQFAFDAVATGAVTPANATYARNDLVYVQVDDPSESDGSSVPAVTRKYVAGMASASPVDPALPVSRAFAIARISVPASGGGSPTVTWVAPYAVAAGGILPVATLALLNAMTGAPGQHAEVYGDTTTANNGEYRWNGSAWKADERLFGFGASLIGGAPPATARLLTQAGWTTASTVASGDANIPFPVAFPNGVLSVTLQRYDFSTFTLTGEILNTVQSLSQVNFRVYTAAGVALGSASNIPYLYKAVGW